ncbi:MAG: hypothetical protein KGJ23_08815 [Euryarchaeota archaeon]|nr:hypothetical protein [Euryarchaeota archaeon]MDE1836705.1 hypothetical protein [Euryarchaeota archaeon]MDE1880266.1 hypothetical protein [Euryarchaeota archaeon]MDE2044675.1 hypothetical protein [Thermoplasmata archaeon]
MISEKDLEPALPYPDSPFVVRLRPEKFTSMRAAAEFAKALNPDYIVQFYQGDDHREKAQCSLYPHAMEPIGGYVDEGGGVG